MAEYPHGTVSYHAGHNPTESTGAVTGIHPPSGTVAGDLLVFAVVTDGSADPPSMTATAPASAPVLLNYVTQSGVGLAIFYAWAAQSSNSDTYACTDSGDHTYVSCVPFQPDNIDPTTPLTWINSNTQAATTSVSISGGAIPSDLYSGTVLAYTAADGPDANGLSQFSSWANSTTFTRTSNTAPHTIDEFVDVSRAIGTGLGFGMGMGFFQDQNFGGTIAATTVTAANSFKRSNACVFINPKKRETDRIRTIFAYKDDSTHILTDYVTPSITWPAEADDGLLLLWVRNGKSTGSPSTASITGCGMTWTAVATIAAPDSINKMSLFRAQGTPSDGALTISAGVCTEMNLNVLVIPDVVVGNNGADCIAQSQSGTQDNRSGPGDDTFDLTFATAPSNSLPQTLGHDLSSTNKEHGGILIEVTAADETADLNYVLAFLTVWLSSGAGASVQDTIPSGQSWIHYPNHVAGGFEGDAGAWCFYQGRGASGPGSGWGVILA